MLIPLWNHQGVIPPIDEQNPTSFERAPYPTDLKQVVERFSTSLERCEVLEGFLSHRSEMHRMGIVSGIQWLDGSFMENVEMLENRPPNDMDVVTFADVSANVQQSLSAGDVQKLTDVDWIKATYKVDFYINLLSDPPETLIELAAYWYSMWSHRRSQQWKGFLSVKLDASQDQAASDLLGIRKRELQNEQN
ncbi:hypothetical protein PSTH1771_11480 [Pseudomonas syringae pv. theae]|uniref:DUF6932 family protein n=1 Tax=Pseudomonas syringae TaxID=317 RepID=UPI001E648FA4|nr:hypothetical protein [Pseudomonas syringae]GKQ32696.1 hypothetical protein PSTH68_24275 [Pseudomonas syringae pv. theae]GKS05634.1 hypothetical protein PSTH1771_11480 [Pseudomonas syringae pv. theae]